jgi:hypothetical protein
MTDIKPFDKQLLADFNVRVIRSDNSDQDIIANLQYQTEDHYVVTDPMIVVFEGGDVSETGDGEMVVVSESSPPTLVFMPYCPMAAQNIHIKLKTSEIEFCVPARQQLVGGYIKAIMRMRSDALGTKASTRLN